MSSGVESRARTPRKYSSDTIYKPQVLRKKKLQALIDSEVQHSRAKGVIRITEEVLIMSDDEGVTNDTRNPAVPTIEIDSESTRGEPLVYDFAEKYIPEEFRPEQPELHRPTLVHVDSTPRYPDDNDAAPPPEDLSRRGIHIPSRTSSSHTASLPQKSRRRVSGSSVFTMPEALDKSSYAESLSSYATSTSSFPKGELPPLQAKAVDGSDRLSPLAEDDPSSFDLVASPSEHGKTFSLERRSEQLFSREHLEEIFADPILLLRFTSYLSRTRPQSIPLLIYYLDSLKALRAINYANAVAEALEPIHGHDFTEHPARPTVNSVLEDKAKQAFEVLVRDELPAYVGHVFIQYVSISVQRRICGTLPPRLREASEGLAEVFCLTDPSRPDNPIVFASEEFHRTTQYGVSYSIGRNCRFLQGPKTNPYSHVRLRQAVKEEREHCEVFLNYRRDGSPFMNLLMIAPLFDSRGKLRYFIGAQVDVSGLVKDCTDLEAMQRLLEKEEAAATANGDHPNESQKKDEFQELSEMLNTTELEIVRRHGGKMHHEYTDDEDDDPRTYRPRLLLKEPGLETPKPGMGFNFNKTGGKLEGIYQNYLLVRPYPSLRILFASPSLRVPGMLQSLFLSRIGGSARVRDELTAALAAGRGVTAKIRWIPSPITSRNSIDSNDSYSIDEGRTRWIHCTPLMGHNGAVGVWMIILIDEDNQEPKRRFKMAPPVPQNIAFDEKHRANRSVSSEGDAYNHKPMSVSEKARSVSNAATTSRPGTAATQHTVRAAGNSGAFAEWERKKAMGADLDGDGSMRSFALM